MNRDPGVELGQGEVGVEALPGVAPVRAPVDAAVVAHQQHVRRARIHGQDVLVDVDVHAADGREGLPAVHGAIEQHGPEVHHVGVGGMHGQRLVVPALPAADALGGRPGPGIAPIRAPRHHHAPGLARREIEDLRTGPRLRQLRAPGQDPEPGIHLLPGHPAVAGPVQGGVPRLLLPLGQRREQHLPVAGVHEHIGDHAVEHLRPAGPRIGREEQPVRGRGVDRGRIQRAGGRRVNYDARDGGPAHGPGEDALAQPGPALAPVGGAQDAAAVVAVGGEVLLPGARVDDVRVDRVERQRAHRERALPVGERPPGDPCVLRAPHPALGSAREDHVHVRGMEDYRRYPPRGDGVGLDDLGPERLPGVRGPHARGGAAGREAQDRAAEDTLTGNLEAGAPPGHSGGAALLDEELPASAGIVLLGRGRRRRGQQHQDGQDPREEGGKNPRRDPRWAHAGPRGVRLRSAFAGPVPASLPSAPACTPVTASMSAAPAAAPVTGTSTSAAPAGVPGIARR